MGRRDERGGPDVLPEVGGGAKSSVPVRRVQRLEARAERHAGARSGEFVRPSQRRESGRGERFELFERVDVCCRTLGRETRISDRTLRLRRRPRGDEEPRARRVVRVCFKFVR